ncbi:EndoU domain-containing protein [Rhodospirillales bacterium]|nr:EndoU domain-containing protein [Rhodospirillales bacterium]
MERTPHNGDHVFEVSIFNKEVRSLVKENMSHDFFDDHWADEQVRDVLAETADEARKVVQKRFPADDGFVISSVKPLALA